MSDRENENLLDVNNLDEEKHSVILTIVSRGFADIVIEAGRHAGATGATVINAHGSGVKEAEKFMNATILPEKEIVLTVVGRDILSKVMSSITDRAGLMSEGKGISFSLPISHIVGFTK